MSSKRDGPKVALLDSSSYDAPPPLSPQSAGSSSSINEADGTGAKPAGCWSVLVQKVFKGDLKVAGYALGLLIASTGNSIMFKKMTNKMTNYPYFLSQLTTAVYLPIFFGIVLWEFKFTNWITPSMTSFPKTKFLVMGMFDALSGIFMLFGGIHTSGSFQALLLNAVIPFTMGLSILVLRTKYLRTQYAGALVIMIGVCVVMVPNAVSGDNSSNQAVFNLIFLLSTIPQAFSSIYKEIAFGDIELDVNYLQAWVAFFQFFLGLLLAPLNSLPFLEDAYVPFKSIPETISNGAKCLGAVNTVLLYNRTDDGISYYPSCWTDENNKGGAPSDSHCDDCEGAWIPTFFYICFNCAYNLFIVLVIKYGSAALLWIILTLRLPLVQIAFAISAINNPPDAFKATSIIGLLVIIAGLVLYRWSSVASVAVDSNEEGELLPNGGSSHKDEEDPVHGILDPTQPMQSDAANQRLIYAGDGGSNNW